MDDLRAAFQGFDHVLPTPPPLLISPMLLASEAFASYDIHTPFEELQTSEAVFSEPSQSPSHDLPIFTQPVTDFPQEHIGSEPMETETHTDAYGNRHVRRFGFRSSCRGTLSEMQKMQKTSEEATTALVVEEPLIDYSIPMADASQYDGANDQTSTIEVNTDRDSELKVLSSQNVLPDKADLPTGNARGEQFAPCTAPRASS